MADWLDESGEELSENDEWRCNLSPIKHGKNGFVVNFDDELHLRLIGDEELFDADTLNHSSDNFSFMEAKTQRDFFDRDTELAEDDTLGGDDMISDD